jgi:ABC-type amino acid transport substrate-binding protein
MVRRALAGAVGACLVLAGCGVQLPTDPDGTLDRVRDGRLVVGVSPEPPWTDMPDTTSGEPFGREPDLLRGFARSLGAEVTWVTGGEQSLVDRLERGSLDVVVGGLTDRSPWSERVALTLPYVSTTGPDGSEEKHVMAAPMGENAFLVALESYLLDQDLP